MATIVEIADYLLTHSEDGLSNRKLQKYSILRKDFILQKMVSRYFKRILALGGMARLTQVSIISIRTMVIALSINQVPLPQAR